MVLNFQDLDCYKSHFLYTSCKFKPNGDTYNNFIDTHGAFGFLARACFEVSAVTLRRRFNSYIVWDQWPLCYDQPDTLIQGYPRVRSMAINAARRRRVVDPARCTLQQTNGPKTDFVAGVSGTTMGGRDGLFFP